MSVPVFACNTHTTGRVLHLRYTNVKRVLRLVERSTSRTRSVLRSTLEAQAAPTYIFCISASCQRTLPGSTSSMARML